MMLTRKISFSQLLTSCMALIDSNYFRARVGVYTLNMRSCKIEPNIHIKRLSTMPLKKSFKISFLMLKVFSLLVVFLNSSFIFTFKGTSESIMKAKLTLPDYMFTIMYFMNNFKYLLLFYQEILKLIQVQNNYLPLNFVTGT